MTSQARGLAESEYGEIDELLEPCSGVPSSVRAMLLVLAYTGLRNGQAQLRMGCLGLGDVGGRSKQPDFHSA